MKTVKSDAVPRYKGHLLAMIAIAIILSFLGFHVLQGQSGDFDLRLDVFAVLCLVIGALASTLVKVARFQKQQEIASEIQRSEIEFGLAAIKSHCIMSLTDTSERIIDVNQKFLDTFEYKYDEIIGKVPYFLHDGAADESVSEDIQYNLAQGRAWTGEHGAVSKSGQKKFFQTTVIPLIDRDGHHVKSMSLRTDVTRQRTVDADKQMRSLLDNLQDEVYIFRVSDLAITYLNRRACARCEWDLDNYLGKRITDTDPNLNEAMFRAHVAPLFDGTEKSVVVQAQQVKGPVEISTRIHEGADGEAVFVSVLRDLKDRKAIERAKMSSVSVVSHELRTPLTSISGSLRMLQGQFQSELVGPAAGLVDLAVRNCDRLMLIVNDILDLEKIEADQMPIEKQPLDLCEFARDAITVNKGFGDEMGVRFVVECDVDIAVVNADNARLMQAISNLLSNAAKYSNRGDTGVVSVSDQGNAWRLTVADKGPGISKGAQHLLFKSFSQLSAADGKKRPGTGLGLAITKAIIQKIDGKCGVESELGKGSRFYFDIPKSDLIDLHADAQLKVVPIRMTKRHGKSDIRPDLKAQPDSKVVEVYAQDSGRH